jgi:hypothetical protein
VQQVALKEQDEKMAALVTRCCGCGRLLAPDDAEIVGLLEFDPPEGNFPVDRADLQAACAECVQKACPRLAVKYPIKPGTKPIGYKPSAE